jgi:hypothetical protein
VSQDQSAGYVEEETPCSRRESNHGRPFHNTSYTYGFLDLQLYLIILNSFPKGSDDGV